MSNLNLANLKVGDEFPMVETDDMITTGYVHFVQTDKKGTTYVEIEEKEQGACELITIKQQRSGKVFVDVDGEWVRLRVTDGKIDWDC